MPHNLMRLSEAVWNQPQLITEAAFTPILQYLSDRNNGLYLRDNAPVVASARKPAQKVGGIGELKISGALTYKSVNMLCSEGGTSYQQLLQDAEELIGSGVDTLLLVADSGGGEARHCFTTANRLRELADEAGVRLVAYIDTVSASACLALTIVADEVIMHPEASTGSVGCVCAVRDMSKAYEMVGIKPIYISSTAGKTPFNNDGSFSDKFLAKMQKDVTALGDKFAEHVHKYTGIPVDEVLALDAQMFNAEEALSLGLVNKIMNHQEFARYITNKE